MPTAQNKGVDIVIKSNLKAYRKEWSKLEKRIMPNNIGFALGGTVFDLAKILNNNTKYTFNKPTPLTKRAFGYIAPTRQQKTIAEKTAWVGLKSERNIPINKAKPRSANYTTGAGQRYRQLMRLQVNGGTRTARNGSYFWTPSKHSQDYGMLNTYGGLNYKRIKTHEANTKQFFVGVPKGKRKIRGSARNSRGLWKRLGEKGRENLQMVASLEKQTQYKKRYPYNRFIRANTNRLLKRNFDKQMMNLKKYLRRRKIKQFRRISYA